MSKVKFRYIEDKTKQYVICDTNVWYSLAQGKFEKLDEVQLIPTLLSLAELATSEAMAYELKLYQDVLKTVYEKGGPILPTNPFDFVLHNHDPNYPLNNDIVKNILTDFTEVLRRDIPQEAELDEETKEKIIKSCQERRGATGEFADFGTDKLGEIRKNINKEVGKKEHLKIDPSEINKEMMKAVLNEHVKDLDYEIDFEEFDWNKIELFMTVTEIYFKKLEITKGMKMHPNDAVDWLNMLYVTPDDKYLTFEKSWRGYIENNDRIKHYLYK